MPEYRQFREAFAEFLGAEKYAHFLQSGIPQKRLKFWQEILWKQFLERHLEYNLPHDELVAAFRVCFLHGDELQKTTIKVQRVNIDYSPGYANVRREKFPFACLDIVANEGNPDIDLVELWYCKKCRAAYEEYHNKFFRRISDETSRLHPSMLTQRVGLEDYLTLHGQIDPAGLDERTQGRLQQRRDDVAELMQEGDELWEWSDGQSLSSIGGLALMRGDIVIQAWRDFRA